MRLPTFAPTLVASLATLLVAGASLSRLTDGLHHWTYEDKRIAAAASGEWRVDPLRVVTAAGASEPVFDRAAAPNDVWLVDFIYTRCISVCQALGTEFFRMQSQLEKDAETGTGTGTRTGAPGRVRLLSVSFDPGHDRPEQLSGYARLHRADARWWSLGAPEIAAAGVTLQRQLGVVVIPDGFGGFVHNAGIHLIDAQGRLRGVYDFAQWEAALAEARRLSRAGAA